MLDRWELLRNSNQLKEIYFGFFMRKFMKKGNCVDSISLVKILFYT